MVAIGDWVATGVSDGLGVGITVALISVGQFLNAEYLISCSVGIMMETDFRLVQSANAKSSMSDGHVGNVIFVIVRLLKAHLPMVFGAASNKREEIHV